MVLQTGGLEARTIKRTLLEDFLNIITNPNIAYLLMTIGGFAIMAELITPGFIGPGVVGIICLGLGFLAMGQLSVNWVGVGLILFAMLLFFLEMQESGIGILGIGGLIAFVIGSLLLFGGLFTTPDIPESGSGASLWLIAGVSGSIVALALSVMYLGRPTGSSTGYMSGPEETMAGQTGIAASDLTPSGKVVVDGEEWEATTDLGRPIQEGEEVRVVGVYGRMLKVSGASVIEEPEERQSFIARLFRRARG